MSTPEDTDSSTVRVPSNWPDTVQSGVLHVIGLAKYAIAYTRSWAADSSNARMRLTAENQQKDDEIALLREECRIKDARMERIPPAQRPQYTPSQRMAIMELRAARGWSLAQTAKAFLVTPATIASWASRMDEQGPDALVQLPQPVNKMPEFTRHIVQRLKTLCPAMGKVKIAETLARAGLHLGATTVGRILKEPPHPGREQQSPSTEPIDQQATTEGESADEKPTRVVTAKRINHVWHTDLTVMPTLLGFWVAWLPFALPQCWPFCWWVAIVLDHFSRRVMGVTAFKQQPTSEAVRAFLGRVIHNAKAKPKYIVCDKGPQFWCEGFKDWCKRKGIKPPRYGAVGQHGSIAMVERVILTMKCLVGLWPVVPLRRQDFRRDLALTIDWYNRHRPHMSLGGRTPHEVYHALPPANRAPRFETRPRWPRSSRCAKPQTLVKGQPGVTLELQVSYHKGRKHLPLVALCRAA